MLVHSKLRSWLTIIGIVIGVGAVVGIVSLGDAMQASVQSRLSTLDLAHITITPGYSRASEGFGRFGPRTTTTNVELTDKDIDALRGIPEIKYITGQISGRVNVSYGTESASLSATGVDPQVWKYMNSVTLGSGRLLEPADNYVAVIGSGVSTGIFEKEVGINQIMNFGGKSVRVVGILSSEGGGGDNQIYMPINAAVNVITDAKKDVYDSIQVEAQSPEVVDAANTAIVKKLLISRHDNKPSDQDFTVSTTASMASAVTSMVTSMSLFLGAIAAVSLLVGAVGIANTMFTSVLEKTKEIGTMKAIGAKNKDILMIFLFNSAMVGLVGGIFGVMLGALLSALFPMIGVTMMRGGSGSSMSLSPSLMFSGLALAVIIGVISGVVPAYRASKLKPVDALRYE
ncbi:MAG: putative transport system permease protein [Euryarchaeota archaeon]|nr:putative transport system permease protein [Euryarchaeota archaeon]